MHNTNPLSNNPFNLDPFSYSEWYRIGVLEMGKG